MKKELTILSVAALALASCAKDTTTADGAARHDGSGGDLIVARDGQHAGDATIATEATLGQEGLRDGRSSLCGGVVCAAGSVCCGPAQCGSCVPENSGAYCPPSCPDAGIAACEPIPSGFCDPSATSACIEGVRTCRCTPVCSGVRPQPGEEYAWKCTTPSDPRCPPTEPGGGTDCSAPGLVCHYGACDSATCTAGKWQVAGPPP